MASLLPNLKSSSASTSLASGTEVPWVHCIAIFGTHRRPVFLPAEFLKKGLFLIRFAAGSLGAACRPFGLLDLLAFSLASWSSALRSSFLHHSSCHLLYSRWG